LLLRITGLVCAFVGGWGIAAAQIPTQPPEIGTIVSRMEQAQHESAIKTKPFTIKRDYRLLDKENEPKAHLVATISFVPPDQKQYQIESSHGGMGEKVLRDILDRETETPKDPERNEISDDNYDFQLLGSETLEGRLCYIVSLAPKRKDKELIRGQAWVDAENFNIRRIEGAPAKSPSWWVHDVQILMTFAEVDGVWLRTFMRAVASVRFKGKYEMISRNLEYHSTEQASVHRRQLTEIQEGAA
jgi:hypothetical protein